MHRIVARGNFPKVFVLHIHKPYFPVCLFGGQQLPISTQILRNKSLMPAAEHTQHLVFDGLLQCDFGFGSQVPSQWVVLDVFWKNCSKVSSCFSFLVSCHSRERKMRIQLEMGRKWKKTDMIEKKTTQLRSNFDWELQSLDMAEHSYMFPYFVLCTEMQISQMKQRVFHPGLSEQCGFLTLTKMKWKSPWCQGF